MYFCIFYVGILNIILIYIKSYLFNIDKGGNFFYFVWLMGVFLLELYVFGLVLYIINSFICNG